MKKFYTVNRPMVSAEDFDGETVVIHFDTGNYYSLDNFGSLLWQAIESGSNLGQLPEILQNHFPAAETAWADLVDKVTAELLKEDLIRPLAEPPQKPSKDLDLTILGPAPRPADLGTVSKFDDLQEMLLMDPIHDIDDEAGWPHARQ